jgi:hypothetical protein
MFPSDDFFDDVIATPGECLPAGLSSSGAGDGPAFPLTASHAHLVGQPQVGHPYGASVYGAQLQGYFLQLGLLFSLETRPGAPKNSRGLFLPSLFEYEVSHLRTKLRTYIASIYEQTT